MKDKINFFIVGAQKAGTSWMYACMYEHPEICIPNKEPHFFSREKNLKKGLNWYLDTYNRCDINSVKGECSTSYLSALEVPEKLYEHNPNAKIIISLRNPIDRAFSQYRNSIKAGEIDSSVTFKEACKKDSSIVEQGMYYEQVKRYFNTFGKENVLVLIYEDIKEDSSLFITNVFKFLNVDSNFVPSLLNRKVNTARTPRFVFLDRIMIHTAEAMRKIGLEKIVWSVKKGGIPALLRKFNTSKVELTLQESEKANLRSAFKPNIKKLSELIDRDIVTRWSL